ncbi:uncharacterized protein LOC134656898 [Cydia amplana]|uniref:uncharacterized protein LOC134656898 n=1 Tax=Cydia amplana TaxID=1869771 RepID=UPI002FE5FE98
MDLSAQEVIDGILSKEATETPSDSVKLEELDLELPKWFDEKKYNQGRRFYWDNCFSLTSSMLMGLLAVLAVPSILKILISSRRSSSQYTSYKRYLSTILHTSSWFECELKPGTTAWKSLYTVRSRHLKAGLAAKLQGLGAVSQRDIALTQFGFIGFSILKPDKFGVRQTEEFDWDAYCHTWAVIGHMIGLQDRYNLCRRNVEETRQVCQGILDRVYTPCLENVPEYFEHMARVLLESMWCVNPTINVESALYAVREMADVPGYIYTEADRIHLQRRIREKLKGKPIDSGVDSCELISAPAVEGLPTRAPRLLRLRDYETIDHAPEYSSLPFWSKYNLNFIYLIMFFHTTFLGRIYFKLNYLYSLWLMKYCPYLAFFKFGIRNSFVNIFTEDPTDDTKPKPNSEYNKPKPPETWSRIILGAFW